MMISKLVISGFADKIRVVVDFAKDLIVFDFEAAILNFPVSVWFNIPASSIEFLDTESVGQSFEFQ